MKHAVHSVTAVVLLVLLMGVSAATAQNSEPQAPEAVVGTAFTFQGRIVDNAFRPTAPSTSSSACITLRLRAARSVQP